MSLFSFSGAVWFGFIAYCFYSAYTFRNLLTIPPCEDKETCLKPYLLENPRLQIFVFTSYFHAPNADEDMDLVYHDSDFNFSKTSDEVLVNYSLPRIVKERNSTLTIHIFLAPDTFKSKKWRNLATSGKVCHAATMLAIHYTPPPSPFSLLGEQNKTNGSVKKGTPSEVSERPVVHLRSIIPFSLMTDLQPLPSKRIPSDIVHKIKKPSSRHYMPILHMDILSQRLEHLVPVSDIEGTEANFTLRYSQTSLPKLKLWLQFEAALHSLAHLGFSPKDLDEVKGIFDTNLYLLGVTFCVAALHLTFDILAFKNDISFWKGRDSLVGLSVGAVIWRAFAQVVIFLHLFEEDTSMLVLGPAGVAVIIEFWKVSKTYRVSSKEDPSNQGQEDLTRSLDSQAFQYLSYLLYPLCAIGAMYSLLYMPHKSWYSWLISSLVNGVYAFGFLFMLPQLFINYHLKSVAHLPWRAFMYKAFNTFIDDLFAFIITMPTSHRLACFRDDVVFVIYLYQRWLYPVDKSRLNEFGTSGDQEHNSGDKSKRKKE